MADPEGETADDTGRGSRRRPSRRVLIGAGLIVVLLAAVGAALLSAGDDEVCCAPDPETTRETGPRPELEEVGEVEGLDASQQIDQVLLTGFEGAKVEDEVLEEVRDHQLGGILIAAENWEGVSAGRKLVAGLGKVARQAGDVPPLIATAQEGGSGRSLDDLPPEKTQTQIADEGDPDAVTKWSEQAAEALADAGFDLDLFPVADVATLDSPLADRVFSDSTGLVAELTADALEGCEAAELACAPAHFPGLGAAAGDTATAPAGVALDEAALRSRDLPPFEAAFKSGAPAVVLSLAFYSAIDGTTPAALSKPIATDLLRRDLGFKGVAITDDLSAGAIRGSYEPGEAAVRALDAGADLIQISDPGDVAPARRAIEEALADGELEADRLAEAVGRVVELKRGSGLIEDEGGEGGGGKGEKSREEKSSRN